MENEVKYFKYKDTYNYEKETHDVYVRVLESDSQYTTCDLISFRDGEFYHLYMNDSVPTFFLKDEITKEEFESVAFIITKRILNVK